MALRFITPYEVIKAGSLTGNLTSIETDISRFDELGAVVEWAYTSVNPVGTVSVEVKNGSSAWSTLSLSSTTTVSGAAGNFNINLTDLCFEKIRFVYTRISGDGTMTISIFAKGRGV